MQNTKLTFNGLLLIVLIFAAFTFFITIYITHKADRTAVNQFYPIEGTDLAVRYSSLEPDGLDEGSENVNSLRVKGRFGFDWGAALEGSSLYLNEYASTDLGLSLCDLVRVDLSSFRKELLCPNTILRGRCASGELVCVRNVLLPANEPKTSSLCAFYSLTSPSLRPESDRAEVLFLDPATGETLYSVFDDEAMTDAFEARYLARTLEEVRG